MTQIISVVLPVYNGAKTIARAVDSILAQTEKAFELIIVNDGSTDNTQALLESYTDRRIRILNQENMGLAASLNRGIQESQGLYIARMDADDVALPDRFRNQLNLMEQNTSLAVVGSAIKVVYSNGTVRIRQRPLDTTSIRRNIVKINPFCHSSVMIRKAVLDKVGLYDVTKDGSKQLLVEDYDLWVRILAAGYEMANLPEVLTIYYREPGSILRSRSLFKRMKQQALTRVHTIRQLNLGYLSYLNIMPVMVLCVFSQYGMKLDPLFNLLSTNRDVHS